MGVLVTGGAGYIGSHMVLDLLDAGEDVIVLDNLSTGVRSAVPDGAKLVEGDVGDQRLVRHLLLRQSHRRHHPFRRLDNRAELGRRSARLLPQQHVQVARACLPARSRRRSRHFIFSSTAAVYGMPEGNPVAEDARLEPDLALRQLQADDRDHATRRGSCPCPPLCGVPLFQCSRRRPAATEWPVYAERHSSDQGGGAGRARQAALFGRFRHRLSDARRNLRARLHPCERSHPRASRRAGAFAGRRGEPEC